jgi:hypothetical protein
MLLAPSSRVAWFVVPLLLAGLTAAGGAPAEPPT